MTCQECGAQGAEKIKVLSYDPLSKYLPPKILCLCKQCMSRLRYGPLNTTHPDDDRDLREEKWERERAEGLDG